MNLHPTGRIGEKPKASHGDPSWNSIHGDILKLRKLTDALEAQADKCLSLKGTPAYGVNVDIGRKMYPEVIAVSDLLDLKIEFLRWAADEVTFKEWKAWHAAGRPQELAAA